MNATNARRNGVTAAGSAMSCCVGMNRELDNKREAEPYSRASPRVHER